MIDRRCAFCGCKESSGYHENGCVLRDDAPPPHPSRWRVGSKLLRTLYIGDRIVGMVDTPEIAAAIVEAMNNRRKG